MSHIIRPLGEEDIEPVHALGSSEPAFRYEKGGFWSHEQLARWFDSQNDVCLGAFEKKTMVGFALTAVHHATRTAMLHNFLVEGGAERDVIAHDLHNEMLRHLEKRGVRSLQFLISERRKEMQRYFEQFGYDNGGAFALMRSDMKPHSWIDDNGASAQRPRSAGRRGRRS